MKKRNLFLVAILLVASLAVLFWGLKSRSGTNSTLSAVTAQPEIQAAESSADSGIHSESIRSAAKEYLAENPAESYLLVSTGQGVYSPIPLNEENSFKITQPDGSENTVHIGKNSFYMEYSNCDNQNCVDEGEVTLENMNTRVLMNMVICLPHQLTLEMLTPDQTEDAICEMLAQEEAYQAAVQEYLASQSENQELQDDAGDNQ